MQKFLVHAGLAVPLPNPNLDTDVIIRIERCAQLGRDHLGEWAFEALRRLPSGDPDPTCVLNQPAFANASILVAGANFGCGSSREMAVWAMLGMGLRCVIAPSFGDIFYSNCFQNGLLPVVLPEAIVQTMLSDASGGELLLKVDLPSQTILTGSGLASFEIEPLRKQMLIEGADQISLTLTHDDDITSWQTRDRSWRPWVYQPLKT